MSKGLPELFRVPVTHDLASRFGEYLASDVYLRSYANTEHWVKREEMNRSAFRVEGFHHFVAVICCWTLLKREFILLTHLLETSK
jgi:hypothetical protein